jgi:hypothetical protein
MRHADSYANSFTEPDGNGYAYTYSHTYSHTDGYAYTDGDAYRDANGNAHTDSNANSHGNGNAYTDGNGYCDSNGYAYTDSYAYCDSNGDSNGDGDGDSNGYAYADSYAYVDAYAYDSAETNPDTEATSDTAASPIGATRSDCAGTREKTSRVPSLTWIDDPVVADVLATPKPNEGVPPASDYSWQARYGKSRSERRTYLRRRVSTNYVGFAESAVKKSKNKIDTPLRIRIRGTLYLLKPREIKERENKTALNRLRRFNESHHSAQTQLHEKELHFKISLL